MNGDSSNNLTMRMRWLLGIRGPDAPLDPSVELTPRMKRLLKIARAEDERAKPFDPMLTPRLRWALGIPHPSKMNVPDATGLTPRARMLLDAGEPPETVTTWILGPNGYWCMTRDYDLDYQDRDLTEGYDERRRRLARETARYTR